HVAVLDHGRVIQQGRYADLAAEAGPFQELLAASKEHHGIVDGDEDPPSAPVTDATGPVVIGGVRRKTAKPEVFEPENGPGLARAVLSAFRHRPAWGLLGVTMFLVMAALSPQGIVTSWLWGRTVDGLDAGADVWPLVAITAGIAVLVMPA